MINTKISPGYLLFLPTVFQEKHAPIFDITSSWIRVPMVHLGDVAGWIYFPGSLSKERLHAAAQKR